MSTNIIEQLKSHAQELAQATGGKLPVEMWAWICLYPDGSISPHVKGCIGETGNEYASAYGQDPQTVIAEALAAWHKAGGITEPSEVALRKLEREAEKLGMRLVPQDAPIRFESCDGKNIDPQSGLIVHPKVI